VTLLDLLYTNPDKTYEDIAGKVQRSTVSVNVDNADEEEAVPNPTSTPPKPKITLDDIEF